MKDLLNERLSEGRRDQVARVREGARILSARGLASASHSIERVGLGTGLAFDRRPTGTEVLANYSRGWVLFGLRRVSRFEWRSFTNRAVITPETAKVPKRLRSLQRKLDLEVRFGQDHDAVIDRCQEGREGWLTAEVADVFRDVHALGCLSTVATYQDGELVGGLWGIAIGGTFGIMSMFHIVDHAGAMALAALSDAAAAGEWSTVDCGSLNENFRRYGAYEVPTQEFCDRIWSGIGTIRPDRPEEA